MTDVKSGLTYALEALVIAALVYMLMGKPPGALKALSIPGQYSAELTSLLLGVLAVLVCYLGKSM